MKRMTALALALAMLLTWTAALAESTGTRIRLRKMKVSYAQSEDEYVRLHDMTLYVTVGSAEGLPTLQVSLNYGDDQELESAFQVAGSQLVMCLGGVSGTYYVDLERLFDEPGKGMLLATALGTAMRMFGADPNALLEATTSKDEDGYYTARFELPTERLGAVTERLLGEQEEADEAQDAGLQALTSQLFQPGQPVEVEIHYGPKKRRARVYILSGESGICLSAHVKQTTGDVELINPSADEAKRDLLDMDRNTRDELVGEIEFLGIKLGSFIRHTSLRRLVGIE